MSVKGAMITRTTTHTFTIVSADRGSGDHEPGTTRTMRAETAAVCNEWLAKLRKFATKIDGPKEQDVPQGKGWGSGSGLDIFVEVPKLISWSSRATDLKEEAADKVSALGGGRSGVALGRLEESFQSSSNDSRGASESSTSLDTSGRRGSASPGGIQARRGSSNVGASTDSCKEGSKESLRRGSSKRGSMPLIMPLHLLREKLMSSHGSSYEASWASGTEAGAEAGESSPWTKLRRGSSALQVKIEDTFRRIVHWPEPIADQPPSPDNTQFKEQQAAEREAQRARRELERAEQAKLQEERRRELIEATKAWLSNDGKKKGSSNNLRAR